MKNDLAPGAKNWITKYFLLIEDGEIQPFDFPMDEESLMRHLHETGLLFGVPKKTLFPSSISLQRFTRDEQLKLLMFEFFIWGYYSKFQQTKKHDFLQSLVQFYGEQNAGNLLEKFIPILREDSEETNIEKILAHRVKVKTPIFGTNYWLNHLSNCFVFLDIVLYLDALNDQHKSFQAEYNHFAVFVLRYLVYAAYLDKQVNEHEQKILWRFLASAELNDLDHQQMEANILYGIQDTQLQLHYFDHPLLATCTYGLCIFLTKGTHKTNEQEEQKLIQLSKFLKLEEDVANQVDILCEKFILEHQKDVEFVNSGSNTNYLYKSFTRKWLRIIGRNKNKLVEELKESKELISLIQKSTKQELTKEEKEAVKEQFMDILKSMPSMAIFMLPGGALLLPLILKIVPDLLPSSFKDNEIE
jgi:hypothetical protein